MTITSGGIAHANSNAENIVIATAWSDQASVCNIEDDVVTNSCLDLAIMQTNTQKDVIAIAHTNRVVL